MNAAFKQRRARVGVLTFVLAALFGLAVMRLIVLVVLQGPRLNSMASRSIPARPNLPRCADRSSIGMASRWRCRRRRARFMRGPARARIQHRGGTRQTRGGVGHDRRRSRRPGWPSPRLSYGWRGAMDRRQAAAGRSAQYRWPRRTQRVQTFLPGEQPGRGGGGVGGDGRPGALRSGTRDTTS